MAQAGGSGSSLGIGGAVNVGVVNNTTHADIDAQAVIDTTGPLAVLANDDLERVALTGGVVASANVGVGLSLGINVITRDTQWHTSVRGLWQVPPTSTPQDRGRRHRRRDRSGRGLHRRPLDGLPRRRLLQGVERAELQTISWRSAARMPRPRGLASATRRTIPGSSQTSSGSATTPTRPTPASAPPATRRSTTSTRIMPTRSSMTRGRSPTRATSRSRP